MSEPDHIPAWGDALARRVAALEDEWFAFRHPPTADGVSVPASLLAPAPTVSPAAAENAEIEHRRAALAALEQEHQAVQARLAEAKQQAATVAQQAATAEVLARENQRRADESAATFTARAAELQAQADALDRTRRVVTRIWPHFMLTPAFAEWKERIEATVLSAAPSSSAALLFANLHGYTACLLENDLKYLRDGLRDISRFLYAWLKETGHNERQSFEIALAWAAAFNEECAGRCEIETPEPGTPANALSMTFPPRGSSPEVVSVRTWCVRDAQRRVIHRAEVFI